MSFCIIQARDDCGGSSERVEKQLAVGGIVEDAERVKVPLSRILISSRGEILSRDFAQHFLFRRTRSQRC